ncbi:hypothetical protein BGZ90_000750, partial [Linnemannia elongata]
MKHTSLPNAWNQFGTKIKEQLFSHSSTTTAEAVSSNAPIVPGSAAAATTATIGITLPTATTPKTGIAGLSLKNKWQREQRSKSMVSLPLTTNPLSLSGHSSSPTTPTAVAPSSSLVSSSALTGIVSLSSASNAMIAMTDASTIVTAGSGAEMGLRPVDE